MDLSVLEHSYFTIISSNNVRFGFKSAYFFDRYLDEAEIKEFATKYMNFVDTPTPDCYYDFSSGSNDDETRDTIKDYSGNGNDAVAHNFA